MTEVRVAFTAQDFDARDRQPVINSGVEILRCGGARETGPTRAGVEFVAGKKQSRAAAGAEINTWGFVAPVTIGEGEFSRLLARDGVLSLGQFAAPFGIGLDDFAK